MEKKLMIGFSSTGSGSKGSISSLCAQADCAPHSPIAFAITPFLRPQITNAVMAGAQVSCLLAADRQEGSDTHKRRTILLKSANRHTTAPLATGGTAGGSWGRLRG